jgi:hypothetical protein
MAVKFTVATRVAAVSVVSTAATTSPATAPYVASALKIATAPAVSSARAMRPCIGNESALTVVSGPLGRRLLRHGRLHQVPVLVKFCLFHDFSSEISSNYLDLLLFTTFARLLTVKR